MSELQRITWRGARGGGTTGRTGRYIQQHVDPLQKGQERGDGEGEGEGEGQGRRTMRIQGIRAGVHVLDDATTRPEEAAAATCTTELQRHLTVARTRSSTCCSMCCIRKCHILRIAKTFKLRPSSPRK